MTLTRTRLKMPTYIHDVLDELEGGKLYMNMKWRPKHSHHKKHN